MKGTTRLPGSLSLRLLEKHPMPFSYLGDFYVT